MQLQSQNSFPADTNPLPKHKASTSLCMENTRSFGGPLLWQPKQGASACYLSAVRTFHGISSCRTCWETLACVSSLSLPVWLGTHSALVVSDSRASAELGHQCSVQLTAATTRQCNNTGVTEGGTYKSIVGYYHYSFKKKDSCIVED